MSVDQLSVDMKATLALIASWVIFLILGGAIALVTGPVDIYILSSFVVIVPYAVVYWFARKKKRWAYLATALISAVLVAITPTTIASNMAPLLLWETVFSTMLLTLISLEGFKGYLQLGKGTA